MSDFVRDKPTTSLPSTTFDFPFASSPDIIRAHQKDAYFQGQLLSHLSSILRSLYGARFSHTYTSEARTFAELLYLGLTTLVGNRTLGEEYCDIVQVTDTTLELPAIALRAGYILSSVLLPYSLTRLLPSFRRRLRLKLESLLTRKQSTFSSYILRNIDTLTSPAPIYALSLTAFYFSGAYYHLSKRIFGLRYIFTRALEPSDQRIGYEVLGVLLACQLAVQAYVHMHSTYSSLPAPANTAAVSGGSAVIDGGVEVSLDPNAYTSGNALLFESGIGNEVVSARVQRITHTSAPGPEVTEGVKLEDEKKCMWISSPQQRKCTLCLEPMREPSATTCGHVFCWGCIVDWVREKPECPLCRQGVSVSHILPLRS